MPPRSAAAGSRPDAFAETEKVARALDRFFRYHSALPPDESVGDFLYLIKPGRLLSAGRLWAQDCARPEQVGARTIAAFGHAVEESQERRADLVALASYALAKTGGIARASAQPVGEHLVALLVAHARALQLTAAVQRDDNEHFARLTASFVAAWPALDGETGHERDAPPPHTTPPQNRFFPNSVPTTGNAALDRAFVALAADNVAVEEPQSLLVALLCPDTSRSATRPPLFGRRGLPPLVRLMALGYDEQRRVGFAAELTVERWAGSDDGIRVIRHPDSLFVIADDAFRQAVALAARLAGDTLPAARRGSGQLLRWSLRRDSPTTDTVFFASGGSIAGAFAVAFRLLQERVAYLRPVLNWGVVSSLAENGALLGVDASTLRAKIEAAETERVILSVDQASESTYLLRLRRRILTAASLDEAVRRCLRSIAYVLLRQYRVGLSLALLAATLVAVTGTRAVQSILADKRTEFDASEEFSATANPPPRSPWRYGWIPVAAIPDPRTFIPLRRCSSSDERPTQPHGLYEWCPPDADAPVIAFNKNAADIPWPAAGVVFPGRAFRIQPDRIGNCACLRFVAPRDGMYRTTATFWGLSLQNYGALLYLFEDKHLVGTYPSIYPSTIWRRDAVYYASKRGKMQTIVHTVHLRQGQTIDLVVSPSPRDEAYRMERSTGILCHVSRLN